VDFSELHFAHPLCLLGNLMIPIVWVLFFIFQQKHQPIHQLEKFIDRHLLPYLLVNYSDKNRFFWKKILLWSLVWSCLTVALAGPRWNFKEVETLSKDQSLVILLDLSESMNGEDIKPSRLIKAKQKIEDLINLSKGVKIGLIAFAADPHMIVPITDDKEMIRQLLPSIETDLVHIQGSRLSLALDMAANMLEAEPGSNKALLVISDGGFEDADFIEVGRKLAKKDLVIHSMGIGSVEGAPLKNYQGKMIKKNGIPIFSKLEKENLQSLSEVGNGHYLEGSYFSQDEVFIVNELKKRAEVQVNIGKKNRIWEEHFYLFILPIIPVILWWFKRGYVLSMVLIFFIPFFKLDATPISNYFKNSEEIGKEALEEGAYETAGHTFKDCYRAGVAYYKAGFFSEAEEMFRNSSREDVSLQAAYNLGNSLAKQEKFKEAIAAYEDVLKKCPEHVKAKENLELVKNIMQEQESSQQGDGDSKNSEDQDKKNTENPTPQEEDQKDNSDPKDVEEKEEKNKEESDSLEKNEAKSQEDQDANLWLNQISNDPKAFLKNKFYIESKKNGTTKGVDPW